MIIVTQLKIRIYQDINWICLISIILKICKKQSDLKLSKIHIYILVHTCFVYHCQGKWRKSLKGKNTKLIYNTSNIENKSFVHGLLFSFKHYLLVVKHVLYFLKGSHVKLFVSIFIQKCNILIWGIKLFYLNCG